MKINDNPFMILLGVIMALIGIGSFLGYHFEPATQNMTYIMIAMAVLLALMVVLGKLKENVGILVIVLWLVLLILRKMLNFDFVYDWLVMSGMPIAAGFFLFIGV
jgi:uncharacterized membrane protein